MKSWPGAIIALLLVAFLAGTAVHAAGTSEARGLILDPEGNPVQGVKITFSNTANETAVYDTQTNKKGRYYIASLLYYNTGDWVVTAELEGYVATHMKVVSKTQQAVIGSFETSLNPDKRPPNIIIRPFGLAIIDFTMTPAEQFYAAREAEQEAIAAEKKKDAPVQRQIDPYAAALKAAGDGEYEESVEWFEKAIKAKPDDPERLEAFAKILYKVGRYEDAAGKANRAIELDPEFLGPYMVLYGIHVATKDYEAAQGALDKAAEVSPGNVQVMQQSAWLATETGRTEDAIAVFKELAERNPENVESWMTLGGLYAETGQNELSEQAYQKVVELDPSNAYQTFFNIGALIENKPDMSDKDTQRAIEAFRKAIEIKPDYAPAHKRLGLALLRTGDMAGALESLKEYTVLAPHAPDVGQVQGMVKALSK